MRVGFILFLVACLATTGCWRDGSNRDFFVASDPIVCTVAFDVATITLTDGTEGVAFSDTTSLLAATAGGVAPFSYTGFFDAASNLLVEVDGDIVSGAGGAGVAGFFSTVVTVVDATGVCSSSVTVNVTINPAGPVEICNNGVDDDGDTLVDCADPDCAADPICVVPPGPTIDQGSSLTHTNGGTVGGTDSVLGSALSGVDTVPDFIGVQSNMGGTAGDRSFVIPINSSGVGLDPATVNTTNVTIFEVPTFLNLATTDYTVTYSAGPPETITVTIPGGGAGLALVDGGTYVITITAAVQNLSGDAFLLPPGNPINSIRFLTAPDRDTLVFLGLSSTGPGCAGCHAGGAPPGGPAVDGNIANPAGAADDSPITLDFTRGGGAATMFASLARVDSTTPGRTYVSLGGITGFGAFDPDSSVLVNKLIATPAFGASMPLFGTVLDGSAAPLGAGGDAEPPPTDPDTAAIISEGKFVLQVRSWIRGGALPAPD